jgi:spermidine synthase
MLHPSPKRVAFIGVATGISVSSVLEFPVERVLAIELFPEVLRAAEYFEEANQRVLHDPRVETVVADGRNHLFATRERFDVIVGDIFSPWRAGTGYLYTSEHFQSLAAHLNDGGIFVQWLPGHQLRVEEVRMIVATFMDAFPSTTLWLNMPKPRFPFLGLVGYVDANAGPSRADRQRVAGSTVFPFLGYVCGPAALKEWAASAPRNSDEFPRVEYGAAVAGRFHRGQNIVELHRLLNWLGRDSGPP